MSFDTQMPGLRALQDIGWRVSATRVYGVKPYSHFNNKDKWMRFERGGPCGVFCFRISIISGKKQCKKQRVVWATMIYAN